MKNLFEKRRNFVNVEFGLRTKGTHMNNNKKKKLLLKLWKESKRKFTK